MLAGVCCRQQARQLRKPMLIITVENRPNWNNPPLATLLLILVNVLVFFAYQGKDPQRMDQAWRWYEAITLHQPQSISSDEKMDTVRTIFHKFQEMTFLCRIAVA
jgi:hypothetical protein